MKRICFMFSLLILLLLSSCTFMRSDTEITTTTIQPSVTTTFDHDRVSYVIDVLDYSDNTFVNIEGVITAVDDGDFFVQDTTAGIYVSGGSTFGLSIDTSFIGTEVRISGKKSVMDGIIQLKIKNLSDIKILNNQSTLPEPLVVSDYTTLSLYEGRLITLVNVDMVNRVIYDHEDQFIVNVIGNLSIQNKHYVDVTGVYYHSEAYGHLMIVNYNKDIVGSSYITDSDKLKRAYELLYMPDNISLNYTLPTQYDDVVITWTTESPEIRIVENDLVRVDSSSEDIEIDLKASFSLNDELPLEKIYHLNLVEQAYWSLELTNYFYYDGPVFPEDKLNGDFWNENALQEVEFSSCVDGDTARFLVTQPDGTIENESIRFLGVNTLETHHPDIGAEEWGYPGSEYTCHVLTQGSHFYLESDMVEGPRDDYGRLLAWVWVDEELLQYNLMALGLADDRYTFYTGEPAKYDVLIRETQDKAQLEDIGMWSDLLDPYWDYEQNAPKG